MWRVVPFLLISVLAIADAPQAFDEPRGQLTLQSAIGAALTNSPALAPYAWDLRIGDARIVQAGLRPNPEISLEAENIVIGNGAERSTATRTITATPASPSVEPNLDDANKPMRLRPQLSRGELSPSFERETQSGLGGFHNVEITLSLSQIIELGGNRAARIAVAERERDVVAWDYEVARFEVMGDVVARFTDALVAQERLREEHAIADLADKLAATVAQTVEAGSESPLEARRTHAAAERAKLDLQARERELKLARLRLAATWGSTQPAFDEVAGDITIAPELPALEQILAHRSEHPMLQRWGSELARRGAVFNRERAQRVPDLTLRLGYRATGVDEGDTRALALGLDGFSASRSSAGDDDWEHSLVIEASLPIPIFHRNQGSIREAELSQEKLGDQQRVWEAEFVSALTEQHLAAEAARERIQGLSERVLPELESTFRLTEEGYRRGKFGVLAVLDAQRAAADTRSALLDARIAYHRAVTEMERLTGAGINSDFARLNKEKQNENTEKVEDKNDE